MKIGYQGIPGAYSDEATRRYIETLGHSRYHTYSSKGFATFKLLLGALLCEEIERAVFPVENSTTGIIARTMDLFRYQEIQVIQELYTPIRHRLLGIEGSTIERITKVLSHPEALIQCEDFFQAHPWLSAVPFGDTATAARFVFEEQDPTVAALASERAGELYHLTTLKDHIQTEQDNTTRFYVVRKLNESYQVKGADKLSLYVETSHEPGALTKLLQQFEPFRVNLVSLNARPISQRPFSYGFFMEAQINEQYGKLEDLLVALRSFATHVQVLGYFKTVKNLFEEE